ncbi:MAG TPA: amino acid ABC transporter substrate-binding protein [Streptosporangiaceae bacterium]
MRATLPWFSRDAIAMGAVALSVGVLAACSGGNANTSASSGASASTSPITIGTSLSLTGSRSADGQAFQKGYALWVKDVNAAGGILGRQIKLTVLDDASSPNQVVTNYQTLINTDHVDLTFGPFSSLLTRPASVVAARNGYAFIEGAGGAPAVFQTPQNEADHNVFDVSLPSADSLIPLVTYIKSLPASERPRTAAFPMADNPFADAAVQTAERTLSQIGVRNVYQKVFPEEPSAYRQPADQVASKHPDLVVLGSTLPTMQGFMKAFEADHYTPKMFIGVSGPDQGQAFISAVGAANATGIMVPDPWYPGFQNAASEKMVNEYVHQYGGTADGVNADVAEAYSVGQVAEQAMVATGGTDNSKIIQYLHSGVTLNSVQGSVKFDSLGENASAAAFIFQWQDNGTSFVQVLPQHAAGSKPVVLKAPWATG